MNRQLTLGELLEMQDELNCLINPHWRRDRTPEDFSVAILDELSELMGSGRKWAWWKSSGRPNFWNERVEMLDIIFFYLSKIILNTDQKITKRQLNAFVGLESEPLLIPPMFDDDGGFNNRIFIQCANRLLAGPGNLQALKLFVTATGLTSLELSAIYTGKYQLNIIRQNEGYRSGKYKKVKDGVEDCERLMYIVEGFLNDITLSLTDVSKAVEEEFYCDPRIQLEDEPKQKMIFAHCF